MNGFIVLIIVVSALALFDVLALQFGVDSRIDPFDPRRSR
jgi:hypothetical protein